MKKNISINIGGIIFHIEEDGYDKLKNYLDSVNKYFSTFEDSKEIIEDIEGRIAEIFLSKLDDGKQIITIEDIDELIATMGTTKDFEANIETEPEDLKSENSKTEEEETSDNSKEKAKRLYRDEQKKIIGGVASGLAHYLGIDAIWVRLIFLAALLNVVFWGLSGFAFIAYIVLWAAVPGKNDLKDDKQIKKLFRSSEDHVISGVCGGIASYFGADPVLIRVLFIISIFLGGAGVVVYIILWIIMPEAKTLTEKMQMQGEPVTLSNIEENVKKSLNVKEGEENAFLKILLFPFRIIALVFKALGEGLGPILKFAVEGFRIFVGIILVLLGFVLSVSLTIALTILLGIGSGWEYWWDLGELSPSQLSQMLGNLGIVAAYLAFLIPSIALILIGLTVVVKRAIVKAYVSWSLFGLWVIGIVILIFTVPKIANEFRTENNYREEIKIPVQDFIPTLALNDFEYDDYNQVELKLRGHKDSLNYRAAMNFESRGNNKANAKENAQAVDYKIREVGTEIVFDSDLNFNDVPFRFQTLDITFYIPFGKTFRMDEDLADILRNTLYPDGYSANQMEGNDWVFTPKGLVCSTCTEKRERRRRYKSDEKESYQFKNFDEVKLVSQFDFEISQSDKYSIELRGERRYLDDIVLEQRGDQLEIRNIKANMKWWNIDDYERIKIYISMPELEYLEITGASIGEIGEFNTEEIELRLAGASDIQAKINPKELTISAAGASKIELAGTADELDVNLTGASELSAFDFVVRNADVKAIGASKAKIYVSENITADAVGASSIKYRGDARANTNAAGLSSVKKD